MWYSMLIAQIEDESVDYYYITYSVDMPNQRVELFMTDDNARHQVIASASQSISATFKVTVYYNYSTQVEHVLTAVFAPNTSYTTCSISGPSANITQITAVALSITPNQINTILIR